MNIVHHPAELRGQANHGWLKARHSFSFAHWYNPNRIQFGALRVLNDDVVAPGMGFGMHPHENMEIITLVQEGALAHEDSMGNGSVMKPGDVQVMSAGTGVYHSEMNHSKSKAVKLFQIWIFPSEEGVVPRYDQHFFDPSQRVNQWQQIIRPKHAHSKDGLWIHQEAWFALSDLQAGHSLDWKSKVSGHGAYLFVIDGSISLDQHQLKTRDAAGITEYDQFTITATSNARVLVMDIPMIQMP